MSPSNPLGDFWNAWANVGRAPEPQPAMPGWKEGLQWWSQLAGQGREGVDATLERMNAQAGQWFGQMQNLAASFAGRDAAPAEITEAWRKLLGGADGNPVADMFRRMSGSDAHGMDAWLAQVQPYLGSPGTQAGAWLDLPAFGLAREHQQRAQKLMQAQLDYQQRTADYNAQLAKAAKGAFERFEKKLAERSEPGRQLESARALFDLWIDAAEESWAEIALSIEFRRVYGDMVNAQMRLRAGVQAQIEQAASLLGLPTRSELNGSHKKLAALEREVRALRRQLEARDQAGPGDDSGPLEDDAPDMSDDYDAPRAARAPGQARNASVPRGTVASRDAGKSRRAAASNDASPSRPPARAGAKPATTRKTVLPTVEAPRAAHAKPPRKGR